MKRILPLVIFAAVINSGCAMLFLPKKQKITVSSSVKESKIFVDNELQGKGTATFKTLKNGAKQVVFKLRVIRTITTLWYLTGGSRVTGCA